MRINRGLIDRALNAPSANDNTVIAYRRLVSLVEEYDRIAKDKGLPLKKAPTYVSSMNHALLTRMIADILRDIDRIKNMRERRDVLTGVTFVDDTFNDGIWTYTINEGTTDTVKVALNTDAFTAEFGDIANVTLDYEYMPYERLIDTEGNSYITVSYKEMFKQKLPDTVASLTIDDWTNSNVTTMEGMLLTCQTLTSLTLGDGFNTSSVTSMAGIFKACYVLRSLTLGAMFDTSKVTSMRSMFQHCKALKSLTLAIDFDTSNVTQMDSMFAYCYELPSLDIIKTFDTSKVTTMDYMFQECYAIKSLTLGEGFNTSSVTDMTGLFYGCKALESLTLGDTFTVADQDVLIMGMFVLCNALKSVSLYKSAKDAISYLPNGSTWNVNGTDDTVTTAGDGTDPIWNPTTLPDGWGDEQWTLSRTIQAES